jgi:YegS/Rv2252/BmrU family lipid kinase
VLYIVNPAGHGGAGITAWKQFQTLWPDPIDPEDVIVTERAGQAREIAAVRDDHEVLAAVGGDGTANEIMSGIMEHQEPRPKLAIVPGGTGNDIAREVGIRTVDDAVIALRDGHDRAFDIVRVDYQAAGQHKQRHAFLHGIAGFSSIPMVKPWMKRLLGPKGAYYLGTLLQIVAYRAPHMTVRSEGREYSGRAYIVIAGNTEWSAGGSMRLSPGARTDDGELNVTVIPAKSRFRMTTRLLPRVASGSHTHEPGVLYFPAREVVVYSERPVPLELDGDLFGTTPATFTICPLSLRVVAPGEPYEKTV